MGKSILVIDDDELMRSFVSTVLREEGHDVEEASNGRSGLDRLVKSEFDLVITDQKMPDISGIDVMNEGKRTRPASRWIIITAFGSIDNAVEAMKSGASDYLTKPLRSPDELRRMVQRVLREAEAEQTISFLSEELGKQFPPMDMIFLGEGMERIRELVHDVAPTSASVLLTGASGTGKELIARVIHELSPRKDRPFVAVNCSALADTLLESELFGHEKGAFTGAVSTRKGRFELADKSTIFLDEIGDISPAVQVKLLRVLQERSFERVGGMRAIAVDIRVISATNKELRNEVAAGRFREDLFYRLNVFPIELPPLARRKEAIVPLAEYFVRRFAPNRKDVILMEESKKALIGYGWPGNIRELQNVIERSVILAKGEIGVQHLNLAFSPGDDTIQEGTLKKSEQEAIRKALKRTGGNRQKAADLLGISRRTLQYKIKEYGL